jgi:hypothetical protein
MSDTDRTTALGNLQIAVTAFGRQLGAVENLSPDGLEELKRAVDDMRMRIWSVLMAENSHDYRGFTDRYRLRRAADSLLTLVADVDTGALRLGHREAADLAAAVRELGKRLGKVPKVV